MFYSEHSYIFESLSRLSPVSLLFTKCSDFSSSLIVYSFCYVESL